MRYLGLGVCAIALSVSIACDAADSDGKTMKSIAVDCSFYSESQQVNATFLPNAETAPLQLENWTMEGRLEDSEFEARAFSVSIQVDESSLVTQLYQMENGTIPVNEFAGDHGFTGLNYVRDPKRDVTLQFACFAREQHEPVHHWTDAF